MVFILRRIFNSYQAHLTRLMFPFHAILDDQDVLETFRYHGFYWDFIFPIILAGVLTLHTVITALIYGFYNEKMVFFHQIVLKFLPKYFHFQTEFATIAFFIWLLLCYFFLVFDKMSHLSFILLRNDDPETLELVWPYRRKLLSKNLMKKISKFYKRYEKQYSIILKFFTCTQFYGYIVPLIIEELLHNLMENYTSTYGTIFAIALCPFCFRYIITTIQISIHFLCENCIIQIKQKHYLARMNIEKLFHKFRKRLIILRFNVPYSKCYQFMNKILDLTREIQAFNAFYSKYITITIIFFGSVGSVFTNAVLQSLNYGSLIQLAPWLTFSLAFMFFVFLFNVSCSKTINLNLCIFKRLRQFQSRLLFEKHLSYVQVIKLDLINEYKLLLQKCSFRLSNNSLMSNRLFFFHIFGWFSIFYMKLLSDSKLLNVQA